MTVQPTFRIRHWSAAQPIAERWVALAKTERDIIYGGYAATRTERSTSTVGGYRVQPGDELFGRFAFPTADAAVSHLLNTQQLREQLVSGPTVLEALTIHGPPAELERCRAALVDDDAEYYEIASGLSRLERETGSMPLPLQLCSLESTFTVNDGAAAARISEELVERTVKEPNCIYCGWTQRDDQLVLREAYGSIVGIARHVENAGACVEALVDGPATFGETRLHTTLANMNLFSEFVEDTERKAGYCSADTKRFYAEAGFSRYDVQQSVFGVFLRR